VAIALLLANGLEAIQTAAILTAVPFSVVILLMCVATAKAFHQEHNNLMRAQRKLARDQLTAHVTEQVQDSMQEQYEDQMAGQVDAAVKKQFRRRSADQKDRRS